MNPIFVLNPDGSVEIHHNQLLAVLRPTATGFVLYRREALTANEPANPVDQPQTLAAPEQLLIHLSSTGVDLL